jgi:roadblock/LC7 domain-containing protein
MVGLHGVGKAGAFSPDGRTLLAVSVDGTARLWDVATGTTTGPVFRHQDAVQAGAFSPDGKTVLTGSDDRTAQLWDAATGKAIGAPLHHQIAVQHVAFSPDGKTLLTVGGGMFWLWDAATGKAIGALSQLESPFKTVAFSPDRKTLLTGSDRFTKLWDVDTRKTRGEPLQHQGRILAAAFGPGGKTFLTGSSDGTARLWDVATGTTIGEPLQHQGAVRAVAISPDGRTILTGSSDQTARLWDVAFGKPIGAAIRHQGAVEAVAFSPDGKVIFTKSDGEMAQLWDAPTPSSVSTERIALWTEIITYMELDSSGAAHILTDSAWKRRREMLETLGGPSRTEVPRILKSPLPWHWSEALNSEKAGQWFAACWHLDRLIAATPEDVSLSGPRGQARARLGRWAEADADFVRVATRTTDVMPRYYHALLRLQLGDIDGYRTACAEVFQQFERPADPDTSRRIGKIGVIAPDAVADPGRLLHAAERVATLDPEEPLNGLYRGRALYRAGRYEESTKRVEESAKLLETVWSENPGARAARGYCWLFLALAHQGLGHATEARTWLGKAEEEIDREFALVSEAMQAATELTSSQRELLAVSTWDQRLELALLRREAETLIKQGHPLYLPADVFSP